jgi:hypothetical protein
MIDMKHKEKKGIIKNLGVSRQKIVFYDRYEAQRKKGNYKKSGKICKKQRR